MSTSERHPWPTRRQFLVKVLAAAAAGGCGNGVGAPTSDDESTGDDTTGGTTPTTSDGTTTDGSTTTAGESGSTTGAPEPELPDDPFTLGIASGDPLPEAVILWTRLALDPTVGDGGMPDQKISVYWEVATDELFEVCVLEGTADAEPKFGHTVHVDAHGLMPDTWYYYRFKVGEWTSPTGRTRTLPAEDAAPERFKFATACCQDFSDGFYTGYAKMLEEDLDMMVFLGDYIYENTNQTGVRPHGPTEPMTLAEYRVRHALYKSDENLRAVHQRMPWAMIWDDHEVENDYAGELSQDDLPPEEFLVRRAAAYQAYYEHMPLRLPPPEGPDYKIYHALKWGDLAEMWLLDTRQYRSDQNCNDEPGPGCDGWETYDGTLLGDEQEAWLKDGMMASAAIWKLVAQQIVFSTVNFGGDIVNFDQWDGYPLARQRLLDFFADQQLANVVVISGDLHVGGLGDLGALAEDVNSPVVAAEIVTTSMSSAGNVPPELIEDLVADLPRIKYFNAHSRGYVSHEVTRELYTVRCVMMDTTLEPTSAGVVEAEFYIDAGTPGFRPVP